MTEQSSASRTEVVERLPHRTDGLCNLKGIGLLRWSACAAALRECARSAAHEDEQLVASRAGGWLGGKGGGVA